MKTNKREYGINKLPAALLGGITPVVPRETAWCGTEDGFAIHPASEAVTAGAC